MNVCVWFPSWWKWQKSLSTFNSSFQLFPSFSLERKKAIKIPRMSILICHLCELFLLLLSKKNLLMFVINFLLQFFQFWAAENFFISFVSSTSKKKFLSELTCKFLFFSWELQLEQNWEKFWFYVNFEFLWTFLK